PMAWLPPLRSGATIGVTPQYNARARAVARESVRARVGVACRCLETARAVAPEWVATTRRAAPSLRQATLAASTIASVVGWIQSWRVEGPGSNRTVDEARSASASATIRLMVRTASTG